MVALHQRLNILSYPDSRHSSISWSWDDIFEKKFQKIGHGQIFEKNSPKIGSWTKLWEKFPQKLVMDKCLGKNSKKLVAGQNFGKKDQKYKLNEKGINGELTFLLIGRIFWLPRRDGLATSRYFFRFSYLVLLWYAISCDLSSAHCTTVLRTRL